MDLKSEKWTWVKFRAGWGCDNDNPRSLSSQEAVPAPKASRQILLGVCFLLEKGNGFAPPLHGSHLHLSARFSSAGMGAFLDSWEDDGGRASGQSCKPMLQSVGTKVQGSHQP